MTRDTPSPAIVLDTNVVLDWLVFGNPELAALQTAVASGAVRWIATSPMRQELGYILEGGSLDAWKPSAAAVWAAWDRHCVEVAAPPAESTIGRPRCTDADDQIFIDLAITAPARWLVSRDRAVLKLARRLRAFGVQVVTPPRWTLEPTSDSPRP